MKGISYYCNRTSGRFMMAFVLFCSAAISTSCFGQTASASQLRSLYESHQWFALRDATDRAETPLFYRGIIEAAFNQIKPAQKNLNAVIKSAPHSDDAYSAHEALANLYSRNGLYREVFIQLKAMLAEKPNAEDVKNVISMYSALSQSDQVVLTKKASTLPMFMNEDGTYIPVTVDGHEAHYSLDTGAAFSFMSESEAKRLGLQVQDTETQEGSVTAARFRSRVAVAKDLVVGGLHLENVAFNVLPDAQEPFVDLPAGERGILGIPVLIAMQTLRWDPKGSFAFGFRPKPNDLSTPNLAFDGATTMTQVGVEDKELEFSLDTGATHSILYASFAKEFSNLLKTSGQKESHKLTGLAGSSNYDSVLLPFVKLKLGGLEVSLAPAHVLLQSSSDKSDWVAGNLGRDLLNEARTATIDFHAMTLCLQ